MARYGNISYATPDLAAQDGTPLGAWTPTMQGLSAWTMDPLYTSTGLLAPVGQVHVAPLISPVDATINTMYCAVTTIATTPTANQCFMGIYDGGGTLLRATSDISGQLTTIGLLTAALTSPLDIKQGGLYYAALLQNAATGANIRGGYNSAVASVGKGRFLKTSATGLTALPNPLGTVVTGTHPLFISVV